MNVIEAINQRHSYRGKYKSNTVPREDLITIMRAGLNAPSGCNKQTTSLIAVDDKDVLEKLHKVINPPVGETAPAVICVLTQRIPAYREKCFAVQDYSAAIENMLLAIVELGYQSCWYEGHITDEDKIGYQMAQILNVPDNFELVCFLPVGIAETESALPQKRCRHKKLKVPGKDCARWTNYTTWRSTVCPHPSRRTSWEWNICKSTTATRKKLPMF